MIEVYGDLWTYRADIRVITTNGFVKSNGMAVMGRGCALQAVHRFPKLAEELGTFIHDYGNHVFSLRKFGLVSFPVKHHWRESADPELITRSVQEFLQIINLSTQYVMPRAGCGNGRLEWDRVRPLLRDLPDNVAVISPDDPGFHRIPTR